MFGGEKKKSVHNGGSVETLIGAQVTVRGDIHFSGGLYLEGTVHGGIHAEEGAADAHLTVAEKGVVHGEVRVPVVVVNGQLEGDVHASERVELGPRARIQGNVHYKVVEMAAGAMITGRMIHTEAPLPRQLPGPEAKAAHGEGG
ncbi:MAG: cell shape determination protein CcmA [Lysobacteraceae bacterium]|nr:MAG: cell shape determination protein CcmA [Xanthomonadaceae bacterium]